MLGPRVFKLDMKCLQTKCGRTDDGQRQILKPHLSNQAHNLTSRKLPHPPTPGGHVFRPIWTSFKLISDINKTNIYTKFHDDWAKNVTSRVLFFSRTGTIFELNSQFTRKTAPPTGGHVFQQTGTTFELN
ncbi:hypothetical protein DPMN_003719 [Dreissena polymorpha]|uniref:Uncharacterized protein n=1 Tax=Dreissena polymorpha TaxID=45954 RepID=A0A9D4RV76_DREPO|nr:hypothetical protein DPMN_003719 [Dreissena polymorpha]